MMFIQTPTGAEWRVIYDGCTPTRSPPTTHRSQRTLTYSTTASQSETKAARLLNNGEINVPRLLTSTPCRSSGEGEVSGIR